VSKSLGVDRTVSLTDDDDDEKDLGGVAPGGVRKAPAEKTMPPSGALLTILHRSGIIGSFFTNLFGWLDSYSVDHYRGT
jgi:hypothetical protein